MEFGSTTFLDALLKFFQDHCILGYQALAPHAFELITVLAVIDICITWTLYSGELRMSEIISRVMKISFFMFFILNFDQINYAILQSFQFAGITASGGTMETVPLTPSQIMDKGFEACESTLTYMMDHKLSVLGPGLVMYSTYIFVTLSAFFFMAFQVLITKIEFNVFATLAVILIPFGVLKQTQFLFQRTLSAVIAYGVKLMVMTFILGLFIALFDKSGGIPGWTPESGGNFGEMLQYALSYAAMAFLMWQLPNLAAGFMNGQPSLEGQQAISGAKQSGTPVAALAAMPFTGGTSAAAAGKGANWSQSITVNGQTVNLKLKTIDQQIVKYQGDFKQISMVKKNGAVEPTADTVNATAGDIFGTDIFDDENSGNTQSGTAAINVLDDVAAIRM